jgi:YidC/Oxa1 family membrane protein insertase
LNLEKIVTLGGIIKWINRFIFVPLFGFLGSYILRMVLQLLFYNTDKIGHVTDNFQIILVSSKMKLLSRIAELGEKFKKDPMKSNKKQ